MTDPVNLIVYKPGGGATVAFKNALTDAGGWYNNNSCYNKSVVFYAGYDSNPANWSFTSPAGSYATDVTQSLNDPPGYSGCGPAAPAERDHLRYWASADDTTVWVAASYEVRGCTSFLWWVGHCVSSNGFNRGRNTLASALFTGLSASYRYTYQASVNAYPSGTISSSTTPNVSYDGTVDVLVPRSNVTQISGNHAVWVSDSYNSAPLTSITLSRGQVSSDIYVTFSNQGPGSWGASTVLAYWNGTDDGQPGNGTSWCHAPGSDWSTCNPGVPAWIGYATISPGSNGTFEFQVQAPQVTGTYTLYFRPAQRQADGTYAWMNTANGNRTYDYFTVTVT